MSTKIKLYLKDPNSDTLYVCRFPASLDVTTAYRAGWRTPKTMALQYPGKDIKILATVMRLSHALKQPSKPVDTIMKAISNEAHTQ